MKKVLLIYAVLIAAIALWWVIAEQEWLSRRGHEEKPKALFVSKHSADFNNSIEKIIQSYGELSDNLAKGDTSMKPANELSDKFNQLNLDELKKDTAGIYETAQAIADNTKGSLQQLITDSGLENKRKTFKELSDNFYTLINTIRYDNGELFWMECSSAFPDGSSGYWLTKSKESANPYAKQNCATVKKTINPAPKE